MLVREKKFYRDFFTMTMTIALQNLIVYGVNLADNIMLGAYSETALSGVAIANQVQFLLQWWSRARLREWASSSRNIGASAKQNR